jgi:hypothetical protein
MPEKLRKALEFPQDFLLGDRYFPQLFSRNEHSVQSVVTPEGESVV